MAPAQAPIIRGFFWIGYNRFISSSPQLPLDQRLVFDLAPRRPAAAARLRVDHLQHKPGKQCTAAQARARGTEEDRE